MAAAAYDRAELIACLDPHTVAKGAAYVRAVFKLAWLPQGTLSGRVQGSRPKPYAVAVDLGFEAGDLWVDGECSCPVGYNCKHVAAVLLAGANLVPGPSADDVQAPAVRPEVLARRVSSTARRGAAQGQKTDDDPVDRLRHQRRPALPTHRVLAQDSSRGGRQLGVDR